MKEKRTFLLVYIICVLSLVVLPYICVHSASAKELSFGPVVSGLAATGIVASKSDSGAIPLAKNSLSGINQQTIHFSLDITQTSLKTIRNKDYVKIEGLKPYGSPGEPQLPFKSFVISLPKGSNVSSVNVSGVSYRPLLNKLDIVANPVPVVRLSVDTKTTEAQESNIRIRKGDLTQPRQSNSACKTCNLESFFPGNLISYDTGKDNKNLFVFVKFFPLQYISGSGRAILVTNADITINYQLSDNK